MKRTTSRRVLGSGLLLGAALHVAMLGSLAGCSSGPQVEVDVPLPRTAAEARTIAAVEADPLVTDGPVDERVGTWIAEAVRRELGARGVTVDDADPDLRGRAIVVVNRRTQRVASWSGVSRGMGSEEVVWREGSLVIELEDADNGHLVWRGIAAGVLANAAGGGRKAVDDAVREMFKDWPNG